jgi:hypothetical protein
MPTLGGVPEIIVSLVFNEEGFYFGKEASLRIPETAHHSKECFVSSGVSHPRNLISYPLYRQTSADVAVAAHTAHGRASTGRLRRLAKGHSEVALMCAAISMRRS